MEQYFDNYKRQLSLLLDRNRTLKYKYAIFKAVRPGDIVIDFGCGTGIMGFFALQAGASHVYAIEETTIIDYAQRVAKENGLSDRITFLKKPGKSVLDKEIPQKVDGIISEPVSNLLLEGNAWSTIEYLKRFLKDDGVILPAAGTLYAVPVNAPPEPFHDSEQLIGGPNVYNLDFLGLQRKVFYKSSFERDSWLAEPQPVLKVNLVKDQLADTFKSSVKFVITQPGDFYGLDFYFDLIIFESIQLSSREKVNYQNWSPIFAPSPQRLLVCPNDKLRVSIESEILGPYKEKWRFEYEHHSKLLPADDVWWTTDAAIPTVVGGVMVSDTGLLRLKHDQYFQYDIDNDLEGDFIQLIVQSLNVKEICEIVMQSQRYSLSYEQIQANLIQLLHKLLVNTLVELPIPVERYKTTKFKSLLYIP